ncbi:hypothetical protein D3C81_2017980 [compost metagenome]
MLRAVTRGLHYRSVTDIYDLFLRKPLEEFIRLILGVEIIPVYKLFYLYHSILLLCFAFSVILEHMY